MTLTYTLTFRMWLKEELDDCRALFNDIPKPDLHEILDDDEFELIGRIAVANLKTRILVPKNTMKPTTVTFQRLWDDEIDLDEWLNQIGDAVWFASDTLVRVSFSFICWHPIKGDKVYMWASKADATLQFFAYDKDEYLKNINKFCTESRGQLMMKLYQTNEEIDDEADPFKYSGYCPLKIISSYVWIRK